MPTECPEPGCSYQHDKQHGVVMHYLNKPDHTEHTSKRQVYDALEAMESDESDTAEPSDEGVTEPAEPTTSSESGATSVADGGGGSNPTLDTPPKETRQTATQADTSDGEIGADCPRCSDNLQGAGSGLWRTDKGPKQSEPGDYVCFDCEILIDGESGKTYALIADR